MKTFQFGANLVPVLFTGRSMTIEPRLHDNSVDTASAVGGRIDRWHDESTSVQKTDQVEFPREGWAGPTATSYRDGGARQIPTPDNVLVAFGDWLYQS